MTTSTANPPFDKLPAELLLVVAGYLDVHDLLQLSQTTKPICAIIRTHEASLARPFIAAQQARVRFQLDALDFAGLEIIPALRRLSSVLDTSWPLHKPFVQYCFAKFYSHPSNPEAKKYTYTELRELARMTFTSRCKYAFIFNMHFPKITSELQSIQLAAREKPFWPSDVVWSKDDMHGSSAFLLLDQDLVTFLGLPAPAPGKAYVCRHSDKYTPLWEAVERFVALENKPRCPGVELMKAKMLELVQILPAGAISKWYGV
ncbi:hypothetical protein LTR17_012097 [Elasticomyces elasticus]|nr:hypothetical protein LTR17_012097 [Elasticomyces elasticus]